MHFFRILGFSFAALALFLIPQNSHALVGVDLLGDVASPVIGPAKEKLKSMAIYVWLQPYGGYASGKSDQMRVAPSGATTVANGLSTEGFLYGGRGGLVVMNTFKLGVDYSSQSIKRNTLSETTTGSYVQTPTNGKNTMLGVGVGIDIPYTPLRAFGARYFKATIHGDSASNGDGWGGGFSFVLKSPFILMLESRKLSYSSAPDATGKKASSTLSQYYVALSFMLL